MPVRFADVDHAGIVYYPVFFHYFHQTFEEFFRDRLGGEAYVQLLDHDRIGFPAVASSCEYKAPLKFGEVVEIEMTSARIGTKSITFRYRVFRVRESEAERVLAADGQVTVAVVDLAEFAATPVPERLKSLFEGIAEAS
jgi:4-hydroxybenzoyl-CoA thioesterase